jgi:spore maturation protein CgeB
VSVAGFGYYNRLHFAQGLTDLDLKLWGPGWERASALCPHIQVGGAEFDTGDMVKIYNASRINLNLHSSTHASGVEQGGDFVNPRTFEIAGCGAFQLTDCRTELPQLFEPGREIATFADFRELRSGIERYLRCADERRRIAARSRDRALADHTYSLRMRQMLEAIYPRQYVETRNARQEDPDTVWRLRSEAAPGHDLHETLQAAPDDARVSLADLTRMLASIPGPPGREEITARWMQGIVNAGLRR